MASSDCGDLLAVLTVGRHQFMASSDCGDLLAVLTVGRHQRVSWMSSHSLSTYTKIVLEFFIVTELRKNGCPMFLITE